MICPHRAFVLCLAALALVTLAPPTVSAPLVRKVFDAASSKAEKAAPAASIAERRAEIEKALDAARKTAADERAGTYPVPAGATPSQVTDLGFLLQRLPVLLQAQLDVLGEIEYAVAAFTHGPEIHDDAREQVRGFLQRASRKSA